MFLESSLSDLYDSAVAAFPNTTKRQHAVDPIVIEDTQYVPFLGLKTLFVKSVARNEGRMYNTLILFKGVDYEKNDVRVRSNGQIYSFGKLSLENTNVLLRCNCNDFKFRFAYYDHLDKSLYGVKPKKYESKGGPPANPKEMPGMCKHLMATTLQLSHMLRE